MMLIGQNKRAGSLAKRSEVSTLRRDVGKIAKSGGQRTRRRT